MNLKGGPQHCVILFHGWWNQLVRSYKSCVIQVIEYMPNLVRHQREDVFLLKTLAGQDAFPRLCVSGVPSWSHRKLQAVSKKDSLFFSLIPSWFLLEFNFGCSWFPSLAHNLYQTLLHMTTYKGGTDRVEGYQQLHFDCSAPQVNMGTAGQRFWLPGLPLISWNPPPYLSLLYQGSMTWECSTYW